MGPTAGCSAGSPHPPTPPPPPAWPGHVMAATGYRFIEIRQQPEEEDEWFLPDLKSSFSEVPPASLSSSLLKSYRPGTDLWSRLVPIREQQSLQLSPSNAPWGRERFGGVHSTGHLLLICAFD